MNNESPMNNANKVIKYNNNGQYASVVNDFMIYESDGSLVDTS